MRYNNKYLYEVAGLQAYCGRRCFIIGGGPSLKYFAPENLENVGLVIGVNKAFAKFNPQINYSNDMCFNDMMLTPPPDDEELKQFSYQWKHNYNGLKVFREQIDRKNYKNGECLIKMIDDPCVSFDIVKGIYCGNNSGFGAMMLAVALRANPIYLLGFDLKVEFAEQTGEDRTHWHCGYPGQSPRNLLKKMKQFREPFETIAPKVAELGIDIINLGPNSSLGCFPEQKWQEVLHN